MKKLLKPVLLLLLIVSMSCGDKDPKPADVRIDLKTYVKNDAVVLDSLRYLTPIGYTYSLANLRYYLTRISLVKDDGTVEELKKGHLFNIHKPNTQTIEALDVPPGRYTALTFTFGFSKNDNVVTFLENTIENQNMYWPPTLGPGAYHYMKLEGQYKNDTIDLDNYAFHLGPTFGADYSFDVNRPIDLTINETKKHLSIIMDIEQWFQDPNDYDFAAWKPGIMNRHTAQEIAKANGYNVFRVEVE